MRIGIVGAGAIGLGSAAWLAARGHAVALWSPRGPWPHPLQTQPLHASGVLESTQPVDMVEDAGALCEAAELVIVAVPLNGHRAVMDALAPKLSTRNTVLISSMASLSALYLHEAVRRRGKDVTVAAFGTTALTARREAANRVRIMTRRVSLGVSALPAPRTDAMVALCTALFGDGFYAHAHVLASALSNINPAAHGPLALFNWTRIERAEAWPQYHYMTPRVAAVIERLDAERRALGRAFGVELGSIEQHFANSFGSTAERLADIAADLHAKRGGPPGPTDMATRFLAEDVPYGLVFAEELGRVAGLSLPATRTIVDVAELITGQDLRATNDLIAPLGLLQGGVAGLQARVRLGVA